MISPGVGFSPYSLGVCCQARERRFVFAPSLPGGFNEGSANWTAPRSSRRVKLDQASVALKPSFDCVGGSGMAPVPGGFHGGSAILNWSSIESAGRTEPRSSKPSRTLFWSSVVRPGSGDCFPTLLACRLQQRISRMGLIIDRVAGRN